MSMDEWTPEGIRLYKAAIKAARRQNSARRRRNAKWLDSFIDGKKVGPYPPDNSPDGRKGGGMRIAEFIDCPNDDCDGKVRFDNDDQDYFCASCGMRMVPVVTDNIKEDMKESGETIPFVFTA